MYKLQKVLGMIIGILGICLIFTACSENDDNGTGPTTVSIVGNWELSKVKMTIESLGMDTTFTCQEFGYEYWLVTCNANNTWDMTRKRFGSAEEITSGTYDASKRLIYDGEEQMPYTISGSKLYVTFQEVDSVYGPVTYRMEFVKKGTEPSDSIVGTWEAVKITITNQTTGESGSGSPADFGIEYVYATFNNDDTWSVRSKEIGQDEETRSGTYDPTMRIIYDSSGNQTGTYTITGGKLVITEQTVVGEDTIIYKMELVKKS